MGGKINKVAVLAGRELIIEGILQDELARGKCTSIHTTPDYIGDKQVGTSVEIYIEHESKE